MASLTWVVPVVVVRLDRPGIAKGTAFAAGRSARSAVLKIWDFIVCE